MMHRVQRRARLFFAVGDLGGEARAAVGILHTKECVLTHGVVQQFFIGENSAVVAQQLGDGQHTRLGFGRGRVAVIDGAVGIKHPSVVGLGPFRLRTGFEGLTQMLRMLKGRELWGLATVDRNRGEK